MAPVAALDIGCSKITCLIAHNDPRHPRRVKLWGSGRATSRGFGPSGITDMGGLERAIRRAVEDAEREAGFAITDVVLGITGPKVTSNIIEARIPIGGRNVTAADVRQVQAEAMKHAAERDHKLIAAWPVEYRLDAADGVRDPRGMYARQLGFTLSTVTVPNTIVQTLVECVGRAHLGVSALVPSPVASAVGTLIADEIDHGAVCIDMGAGVTAYSVFINGAPAWAGQVPIGGAHVTADIAQGLGTTFAAAERLKTLHGAASQNLPGLNAQIEAARLGDDGRLRAASLERATLAAIIQPRIEEIFELVEKGLARSGVRRLQPRRIVLTGGTSELPGVREIAEAVLKTPVRLSKPVLAEFMGETLATPAFATASGLLLYQRLELPVVAATTGPDLGADNGQGMAKRMIDWLRENF